MPLTDKNREEVLDICVTYMDTIRWKELIDQNLVALQTSTRKPLFESEQEKLESEARRYTEKLEEFEKCIRELGFRDIEHARTELASYGPSLSICK
jgi:hypothetical protein